MASTGGTRCALSWLIKRNHEDAIHDRDSEKGDEAYGRGDAEIEAGNVESDDAANDGHGNPRERQQAVAHVIEQAVEQSGDQNQADRHDDFQALLGLLQISSELTGPNQPVARWQLDVLGDSLLRLLDGAAQVASANAEFHRNEALQAFVINPGGSRIQADGGQFAQGHVGIGAAGGLVGTLMSPIFAMLSRYSGV